MFNLGCNFYTFNNPFMNFFNMVNPYTAFNPVMPINSIWGFNPYQVNNNNSIFTQQKHNTYNSLKGEALVENALNGLPSEAPVNPLCARYVKNAIVNTGIGAYIPGNGEQTKYMLRQNLNFMEVKAKGEDFAKLPAGSVIVYDANDKVTDQFGNVSNIGEHGHTLIAKGDGTGISDRLENEILKSDRAYTFIPV